MPSVLLDHLNTIYDETIAADVMAKQANWGNRSFGNNINQVRRIVVHLTAGWPRRERAHLFRRRFTYTSNSSTGCIAGSKCGIGTQFYISGDGTVARLIDIPRRTNHAPHVNSSSLGVETSNRSSNAPQRPNQGSHWIAVTQETDDIPGAKLWVTSALAVHDEVSPCWWTSDNYTGPSREPLRTSRMLFNEWQYRAWAILARYLCEEYRLPRNFPLFPHTVRADLNDDSALFRRLVLADERAEVMLRAFAAAPFNIAPDSFETGNEATLQTQYSALIDPLVTTQIPDPNDPSQTITQVVTRRHNRAWVHYIENDLYRGIQGHCYSGSVSGNSSDKSECPGPLFDFYRLAREVWDWWWYPFDFSDAGETDTPMRGYRQWNRETPLLEYYFDENENAHRQRLIDGIHGAISSPATFSLEPNSPIYALANGELVAARFPAAGNTDVVSLGFMLVRHEIFHLPLLNNGVFYYQGSAINPALIDYDQPPDYVYSLYMHLGRPANMSFEQIHPDNPDWLNRILFRKQECDLGVAFYQNDPNHHGIAGDVWNNQPPGSLLRPTTLQAWHADQQMLTTFLTTLSNGETAIVPPRNPVRQPICVLLGDFLGGSGIVRRINDVDAYGIRVETFSPSFRVPGFPIIDTDNWSPTLPPPIHQGLRYPSEWVGDLSLINSTALLLQGVNLDQIDWWPEVAYTTQLEWLLPNKAKLPRDGRVLHYHPLDFMQWINNVTWIHEWHKYEVTDDQDIRVPFIDPSGNPRRPRSRRI